MTERTVVEQLSLQRHHPAPGFSTHGLRGFARASIDPFLNLDDFHMSQPTFPPHPHAGFSAVTVMFEDSAGAFVNRDSLGDRSRIAPGDVHWTQAASGMMHEEIPEVPGVDSHGAQIFVNLSRAHKGAAPRAFHAAAKDIPVVTSKGARVRVLAGAVEGARSPLVELLTPVLLLDVHLEPGAHVVVPVAQAVNLFGVVIGGSGRTGTTALSNHDAVAYSRTGATVSFEAGEQGLHVLVGGGTPIDEPVVFGGPFAMTSREEVQQAMRRFQRGDMGRLEPSF